MTTRETVERYFERLGKADGWEDSFADDMVFTSFTSPNRHVEGREAYLQRTKGFYSMIRNVRLRELMTDGTRACALTRYDLQPPNGAPAFQSDVAEIFTVSDGKIDSIGIYFDSAPYSK